jgi:uncharacterized protein (TIGR02996 family)
MTDRERGFLDAVLADPRDDFPRLVMADWLEEEGRAERAEFIRVQVELAALQCLCKNRDGTFNGACAVCNSNELRRREREGLARNSRQWFEEMRFAAGWSALPPVTHSDHDERNDGGWANGDRYILADFRRGFVASVSLTLSDFLTHAGEIFVAAPVEEVTITDRHPGHDARGYQGWWGTDDLVVGGDNIPLRLHAFLLPSPFWQRGPEDKWDWYHSEAEAHAALSLAAVAYGRDKAGLPALPIKEAVSR